MSYSDWIALFAFVVSGIGIYLSYKNHRSTREWEFYKENIRQKEQEVQEFYSKNNSRVSLIPYFHLLLDKEIHIKNISDEENLILPISLVNVGRETATNVQLVQMSNIDELGGYFKTDGIQNDSHFIRHYIEKKYAFIGESISFTAGCKKHDRACNVSFKIKFNDLVGRTYEQSFRFLYCFPHSKEFTMNHTSNIPICIEDNDKTSSTII
ncbi:hypothetical protein [Oceanobacillus kapialis]|uniref:hypothetical protein n=1 Tax=Oceanobacillus kapialis TaxID=481353 RepID=UPI00384C8C10